MHKNTITLIGFIGSDPEIRITESGKKFAYFSLATNQYLGRNEDGTIREKTDWHSITAWEKQADIAETHLRKGTHALVEGSLHYNEYEKGGQKMTRAQIRAKSILRLDRLEKQDVPIEQDPADEELPF